METNGEFCFWPRFLGTDRQAGEYALRQVTAIERLPLAVDTICGWGRDAAVIRIVCFRAYACSCADDESF